MSPQVRAGFQERVRAALEAGKTLTEAIELAYAWLLKPRRKA